MLPEGVEPDKPLTLEVFDATGRLIVTQRFEARPGVGERVDLGAGLAAGSYVLRLRSIDGTIRAKELIVGGPGL